jgi:hypothetical protein
MNVDFKLVFGSELSGKCKYILAYDGHIIAVSEEGNIEIVNLAKSNKRFSISAGGKIHAEPAIHDGVLYVGFSKDEAEDKGGITAYYLGDLSQPSPDIQEHWTLDCEGIPVQSLLAYEDRLYLKLNDRMDRQSIVYVDRITEKKPSLLDHLTTQFTSVSTLACTPQFRQVYFLSQDDDRVYLNVFDHNANASQPKSTVVSGITKSLVPHVPIAVMGSKIFAVFDRDKNSLCKLDAGESKFDQRLYNDVKEFAMHSMNDIAILNSTGIFFAAKNIKERFVADESTSLPPIIMKDFAAVVGLRKGKVRLYDVSNPMQHIDRNVFDSQADEVTAMATFSNYIAVGNRKGIYRILRFIEKR